MYIRHKTGKDGEEICANYLKKNGYNIIERNFSCKQGEIDIIAEDLKNLELVFIEVKRRTSLEFGNPAEAVDKRKQRHMLLATEYFIFKNHIRNCNIRFDVIEVYNDQINHIKNCEIN